MTGTLHIIDGSTPADGLLQLALLAGPEDGIVSLGPPPEHHRLPGVTPEHAPLGLAWLGGRRIARRFGPAGAIHAWSPRAARAAVTVARRRGQRAVLSLPCVPDAPAMGFIRAAVEAGDLALTVPTEAAARALAALGVAEGAVHVLPPPAAAIDDRQERRRRFRQAVGFAADVPVVAATGRVTPFSGHRYTCWAHAICRHAGSTLRTILHGEGPGLETLAAFTRATGFHAEMALTRWEAPLADVLAAADAAVFFQTRDEGVASLATAMAAGLPIATADTPDAVELLAGDPAALVIPAGAPADATRAILHLIEQPALRARLGAAARDAAGRFAPQRSRERLADIHAAVAGAA